MNTRTRIAAAALAAGALVAAAGCSEADIASRNISKDADNFRVARKITVLNGITGQKVMEIQGLCNVGNDDPAGEVSFTCKTEEGVKKNMVGLGDNGIWAVEQLDYADVSTHHYKFVIIPAAVTPDIEVR
jgi:hypothetical protein